jgi:membrane protease YdiL (CAAX protease family)
LIAIFSRIFIKRKTAAVAAAAILGSLLFSLIHYVGPSGDHFIFGSFIQRAIGGLYFSVIFVTRGFGVTAASHALYDILIWFARM